MKHQLKFYSSKAALFIALIIITGSAYAQDTTMAATTTTATTTSTEKIWYMEPWAWIVGGIILLVIIVLATHSGNISTSANKVTVTKTVTRDTEVI